MFWIIELRKDDLGEGERKEERVLVPALLVGAAKKSTKSSSVNLNQKIDVIRLILIIKKSSRRQLTKSTR